MILAFLLVGVHVGLMDLMSSGGIPWEGPFIPGAGGSGFPAGHPQSMSLPKALAVVLGMKGLSA